MPISEVKMADGRTLIDLTKDTVTAEKLLKGITAHDKAGNAIVGTAETGPALPKDPHTLLLLHGNSMEDSGKYNVPLTNNGVVVSNAQSRFGGRSLFFDGNAWINFPQKYAPYMDKDFTIDWWEYCMTSDENHQSRYFSTDAGGQYKILGLLLGHLGKQVYCGNGWSMINGADMFNIAQNQWVHWAAVRHGNTFTTYRNGKKFAQTPIVGSIPYDEKTMHCIGGWRYSPGQKWIGYMDEFRISDVARWTSDFVPQNAPYENVQECKDPVIKPLKVTKNGTTPIPEDADGWGPVEVAVPSDKKPEQTYNRTYTQNGEYPIQPSPGQVISGGSIKVQTPVPKQEEAKAVEIKTNGTTVVKPTPGKVMNQVTIKTSTPVPKVEQAKTVQAVKNGPVTVTPDPGKTLSSATVNVAVPSDKKPEQEKEITISENGDYPITPDVGKVLSKVLAHVNVPTGGGGGGIPGFDRVEEETWIPAQDTDTCTWTVNGDDIKLVLCMSEAGTVSGTSGMVGAVTGFIVNNGEVYNMVPMGFKTANSVNGSCLRVYFAIPENGEITLDEKFKAAGVYHIWKFYGTGKP